MPSARPVSHEDIWLLSRLQVLYTNEPYHTVGSDLQSGRVGLAAIRLYSLGGSGEDEIENSATPLSLGRAAFPTVLRMAKALCPTGIRRSLQVSG